MELNPPKNGVLRPGSVGKVTGFHSVLGVFCIVDR